MPLFRDRFSGPRRSSTPEAREEKASFAQRLFAVTLAGRACWTPRDYGGLAREGFAKNPVAYRCVRMLAESAAAVPLVVHVEGRRAPDHALQALLDRPNPEMSASDLLESFFGALQVAGNAYLEAAGEGDTPTELYTLRPDRVRVVPGPDGWPVAWTYDAEGGGARSVTLPRQADGFAPVLHLKLFNPSDDHYGLSPLEVAARAVDTHNASSDWNKALLDNSARPSGALVYAAGSGERLTEAQFERLKAELSDLHTGAGAAGRPLLLEGGLDWKPMALTPAEMDFAEGKHAAAREIALAFGVPPQLLGIPGDNTYSNYKEANAAFWRTAVAPLAERGARAISAWLGPRFGGAVLRPDFDQAPALAAERTELWARLDAATFLSTDEKRRMAGLGLQDPAEADSPAAEDAA